ncbi:MAG: glycogen debranching N-terminal domain-containing protein [Candidatus Gastranaerophilales bacterium]|nr:glycogen debranching N-terminal domain-containing protein [Candidatus Gastranaerophilales bacterium]
MEKDLNGLLFSAFNADDNKIRITQSFQKPEKISPENSSFKIIDKINRFFLQKLGHNKTNKILKNIDSDIYTHISNLYIKDDGKLLIRAINEICSLSSFRINDFFNCITKLEILDSEGIKVLSRVSTLLKGEDSLSKAIKIQDNYISEIIYNRPHFDFKTKVNCILNASKSSEGTHIIKYGNLFLNTQKDGYISLEANKGGGESRSLGLFTGDMQFINQYEFKVTDQNHQKLPLEITLSENKGFYSHDELNFGQTVLATRKRIINGALFERIEFSSSKTAKTDILLSSLIKDIFEVRGMLSANHNKANINYCCDKGIIINKEFDSGDTYGLEITVKEDGKIIFPISSNEDICQIVYQVDLTPNAAKHIDIKIQPLLNNYPYVDGELITDPPESYDEALSIIKNVKKTEFAQIHIEADIPNIQKTLDKSLADLNILVSYINFDGKLLSYIDAGLPRYSALFGRDSIITALSIFPLNQNIARDTLELLANFQGKSFEDRYKKELQDIKDSYWNESAKNSAIAGLKSFYFQKEEAPGKILHELRTGTFARSGMVPHSPYYGTVDATPLWLILFAEYYKWSGDKDFLKKLLPNAETALDWVKTNMIDNYLRFSAAFYSKVKIQNQGWKDSGDSIRHVLNPKGYLSDPEYPIALAEVQGYVYRAYVLMSEIYNELEDTDKANSLIKEAVELKYRFNRDFWLEEEQFYSMALNKNNKSVRNITSNIGHCLAMGIINDDKGNIIEEKIMSSAMFSGWGIRTLGTKCEAFDSISYHNGSVWVHDSALAAMGLSAESISTVTKGLFEAANMFNDNRLPELFAGFQRKADDTYIQEYAEACSPQAWASASVICLLLKLIGLKTQNGELSLNGSYNPEWLKGISIEGIKFRDKIINIEKQFLT